MQYIIVKMSRAIILVHQSSLSYASLINLINDELSIGDKMVFTACSTKEQVLPR